MDLELQMFFTENINGLKIHNNMSNEKLKKSLKDLFLLIYIWFKRIDSAS